MMSLRSLKTHIFFNHSVNSRIVNDNSSSSSVAKKNKTKPEYLLHMLYLTKTTLNRMWFCIICGAIEINSHLLTSHLSQVHNIYAYVNLDDDAIQLQNTQCSQPINDKCRGQGNEVSNPVNDSNTRTLEFDTLMQQDKNTKFELSRRKNEQSALMQRKGGVKDFKSHSRDALCSQSTIEENRSISNESSKPSSMDIDKTGSPVFNFWNLGLVKKCKKKCGLSHMKQGKTSQQFNVLWKNHEKSELKPMKDKVKGLKSAIVKQHLRSQRIRQYRERLRLSKGAICDQNQSKRFRLLNVSKVEIVESPNVLSTSQTKPKLPLNKPNPSLVKCKICSKILVKGYFPRHQKRHIGKRPHACQACDKRFIERKELQHHIKVVHERNRLECKDCKEVYGSRSELVAHRRATHFTDANFVCDVCGKAYHNREGYIYHKMAHRIDESKHYCELCDRKFLTRHKLVVHMRRHTGETPYQCAECGKRFTRLGSLQLHIRNVHLREKNHSCPICGRGFFMRSYVAHHIKKVHHPLGPGEKGDSDL